jgi:uroporphyrinogen decarboxylase
MTNKKKLLRSLAGEAMDVPPVWLMRQAGRYLPEYRETRAQAGDFLSLCYNSDLAAEVTLQPIRRYGFDASILFADILLIPEALGADLWFVTGEGPRLSTITGPEGLKPLKGKDDIHDHLAPIYETVKILSRELPKDQGPAHALKDTDRATFETLLDLLTEATIEYLSKQVEAGAEVIKLFDSWAGSLKGDDFAKYALAPAKRIISELKSRHPGLPVIAFPREAGDAYVGFAKAVGADALAIDTKVDPVWAAQHLQPDGCVQGNLDPRHMVTGGQALVDETRRIVDALKGGPHIFNLGHGITPDADPDNVHRMLEAIRG